MKPDWKDAPEWAKFMAMDSDGEWYWYEKEPGAADTVWFNERGGRSEFAAPSAINWLVTLEGRP